MSCTKAKYTGNIKCNATTFNIVTTSWRHKTIRPSLIPRHSGGIRQVVVLFKRQVPAFHKQFETQNEVHTFSELSEMLPKTWFK